MATSHSEDVGPSHGDAAARHTRGASKIVLGACIALLAIWMARVAVRPVSDPDAWLHLRIGAFLNDGGRFGSLPDPFVTAASFPYVPGQWLPERLGASVFDTLGLGGVAALRSLGVVLVATSVWWMVRGVADREPAALSFVPAVVAATPAVLADRPQVLSLSFLAVLLGAWFRTLHDDRARFWLVPLVWVWASVHGLWVVGVALSAVLVAAHALDHRRLSLRLASLPLLMVGSAALTPNGPTLVLSPLRLAGTATGTIREWQAPATDSPWLLLMLLPAVVTALLWWRAVRPPWSRILLFAVALTLAFSMVRLIVVGGFILSALMAEALQSHRRSARSSPARRESVTVAIASLATAALVSGLALATATRTGDNVPSGLAPALRSSPSGTVVLADHALTGWVEWVAPNTKTVVDLRAELFTPDTLREYSRALEGRPGWREFLTLHQVDIVVADRSSPLNELLSADGWRTRSSTSEYILHTRP